MKNLRKSTKSKKIYENHDEKKRKKKKEKKKKRKKVEVYIIEDFYFFVLNRSANESKDLGAFFALYSIFSPCFICGLQALEVGKSSFFLETILIF